MTYPNVRHYNIILFENFFKDLNRIYNYINFTLNEPKAAKRIYKKIVTSISSLQHFPERFSKLNNPQNYNYHRLLIYNYIVIYEINDTLHEVYILHIFHANQDYFNLL